MHWNYRVVRHFEEDGEWFGFHEAYYEDEDSGVIQDNDSKISVTIDPTSVTGHTLDELKERIRNAFEKPVLDYNSITQTQK
jgi:hypothetical protein